MALIYDLANLATSGLVAQQSAQRDWSPYLVHFTSFQAMKDVRSCVRKEEVIFAKDVVKKLERADRDSFESVRRILRCGRITAHVPSGRREADFPKCVCLSQCTLPGLFGHSERFGRFGFVFKKIDLFNLGGTACLYVNEKTYDELKSRRGDDFIRRLWSSSNIYRPMGYSSVQTDPVQDYTAEREWHLFDDLPLEGNLCALLVPNADYVGKVRELLPTSKKFDMPILPLDMLYNWGV